MTVYAFEWCGCIYETGFAVVSLHTTKAGAYKAMREEVDRCIAEHETNSFNFSWGKGFKLFEYERWRVTTRTVLAT